MTLSSRDGFGMRSYVIPMTIINGGAVIKEAVSLCQAAKVSKFLVPTLG